jgi:hypothetical protein
VDFTTPLYLIFDQSAPVIRSRLAAFVASHPALSFDGAPGSDVSKFRIIDHGAAFDVAITETAFPLADYRRVFDNSFSEKMESALGINLGPHMQHGMVVPAIAKAYLQFALTITKGLDACCVAANAAGVVSGKDYFVESVSGYCDGGPFPTLALVACDLVENGSSLQSRGMDVFAGQEILLAGNGLDEIEMMRRMIRLVHEIATNGPVLKTEIVGDLNPDAVIMLQPLKQGKLLHASIQYGAD